MKLPTIVAIGDSLIKGNPDPETGGWISRVFERKDLLERVKVINEGEGGDNSRDVLERLDSDCIDYRPLGVIVGVGVNDSRIRDSLGGQNEVPLSEFITNLKTILERLKMKGVKSVLLVPPLPVLDYLTDPYKPDKRYKSKWVNKYRESMLDVGKSSETPVIDLYPEWVAKDRKVLERLLPDGVHPSPEGYDYFATRASKKVKEWLSSLGI